MYGISLETSSAALLTAVDDLIRAETRTDPWGRNRSDEAASTAADDDFIRAETCTDPCGLTGPTRQQVLQLMMT